MKFIHESDRIYLQDGEGKMIAEITFPQISDIKAKGLKAKATCPYVIGWFEKHPEHADILD